MSATDDAPLRRPAAFVSCLIGAAYFVAAEAGNLLSFPGVGFATFWPASGLLLGMLAISKRRVWLWYVLATVPAVFAADIALRHIPAPLALTFRIADGLEAFAGAALVRHLIRGRVTLGSPRELWSFLAASAFVAPALGAIVGAAAVHRGYGTESPWHDWQMWWASRALGVILIAPIVVTWNEAVGVPSRRRQTGRRRIEWIAATIVLLAFAVRTFHQPPDSPILAARFPLFLLMPVIIWVAVRFEPRDAALSVAGMALVVVWCTTRGYGALAHRDFALTQQAILVQVFLTVTAGLTLLLASAIYRREQVELRLRDAEQSQLRLIAQLQQALQHIKTLRGMISICANCKQIYNDRGQWQSVESYVSEHTEAEFTHGICPSCGEALYGELWPKIVQRVAQQKSGSA